uniref:Cbb3-type cytochrome c oxidase subunit 3 n=1 Tax=Steinernema glaseri TaxID=37863 RepID=A0A1I8AS20_9BILA
MISEVMDQRTGYGMSILPSDLYVFAWFVCALLLIVKRKPDFLRHRQERCGMTYNGESTNPDEALPRNPLKDLK